MKKEILIVEGHLYLQKTLIDWLEKIYPEFEILAADSCEDAIDTVQASPPSLIIMDSHLTQIDGFETMRRIKADHPHIPILIMADFDCDLNKDYAFSAGADAYLLKDSIQTELLPIIDRLLDRTLKGALKSSIKNYLKEENVMMNKAMYEDVARQWQNLFKIPFPVSGMDKQKESFLALYKVEQENFQTFVTACQN